MYLKWTTLLLKLMKGSHQTKTNQKRREKSNLQKSNKVVVWNWSINKLKKCLLKKLGTVFLLWERKKVIKTVHLLQSSLTNITSISSMITLRILLREGQENQLTIWSLIKEFFVKQKDSMNLSKKPIKTLNIFRKRQILSDLMSIYLLKNNSLAMGNKNCLTSSKKNKSQTIKKILTSIAVCSIMTSQIWRGSEDTFKLHTPALLFIEVPTSSMI